MCKNREVNLFFIFYCSFTKFPWFPGNPAKLQFCIAQRYKKLIFKKHEINFFVDISNRLNGVVVCGVRFGMCVQRWTHSRALGDRILHGWHRGTGVMPWRCQPGSSSCREGSKPSGATYGLKSSDTKSRTKVGVVHPSTDLHVTFAVHPIASTGSGGIIIRFTQT